MAYSLDTIPVRKGEEIDLGSLGRFLQTNLELPVADGIDVKQFGAGHSNLTYEIKVGKWEGVLRRPPLGPVAPKAHDMEREFKVLQELHPRFPIAPKPLAFGNESILGAPFFIMERRKGFVYDTSFPDDLAVTESFCRKLSEEMVNRLVELHSIDYTKTGLTELSRPEGFMERQVHGWIKRYERAKTDEVEGVEELKSWLAANIPSSTRPAVIHYDYKLNNAMFDFNDPAKMVGLFDWEMTTAGDPLADLGAAMSYWIQDDDPEILKEGFGKPPVTVTNGFLTRDEFISLYSKKSGRDVSAIHFYLTFAYFKLAVICQQIYFRWKNGQTNDDRFARFNDKAASLIEYARENAARTI
ncbi:phosphotransferase family protein [Bacillus marinisedimentorum]|uniref:phosphotransferase family protein n=1 Tax=Bacillus marinisedimentorum TaxID=1821260 RepID=UPI0007DF0525|nr:phosphotransferase family protein [Bacillus marinisedimentorum]